jgi:hypothetical protein
LALLTFSFELSASSFELRASSFFMPALSGKSPQSRFFTGIFQRATIRRRTSRIARRRITDKYLWISDYHFNQRTKSSSYLLRRYAISLPREMHEVPCEAGFHRGDKKKRLNR